VCSSDLAGIVHVDNASDDDVLSGGMQFMTSGYLIQDEWITLGDGDHIIRVGDGTRMGTDFVATIASKLTGGGGLDKRDAGTLVLSGDNDYTGGTIIGAGTLQLGDGGMSGSIKGDITDNGMLAFKRSDTFTFDGEISGLGAVKQIGTGTTVLTGDNSYSGGTTITVGALRISKDGNLGAAAGGLTLDGGTLNTTATFASARATTLGAGGGTFAVDSGTTLTMNSAIAGPGALTKADGGRLVLTQNNSYTGGTTIAAGTLQVGNGGTTGSIAGNVTNNGTLAFNRADTVNFGGVISGSGGVEQIGNGTTVLSGMNSYTGNTTISNGTLNVTGSIASSAMTTVMSGAMLTGSGTVGNTTVASGGTFAPGSGTPGSSMTVNGNLSVQSGSHYVTWLDPQTSSLAKVQGRATLGGGTVDAIYANGSYVKKRYTILTASEGVSGRFSGLVNTNLPTNFQPSLGYDANTAYLDLDLRFGKPGDLDDNQNNVGDSLVDFFNRNGGISALFGMLTPEQLAQVAGELPTASQQATFDAMGQFVGLMSDPFIIGRGDCVPDAADDRQTAAKSDLPRCQGWSSWTIAYGGERNSNGDAAVGSHDAMARAYGIAAGADYHIAPGALAGFALAGGGTKFEVAGGDLGTGSSNLLQVGAFMQETIADAYLRAAFAYGWQNVSTDRTVTILGSDQLHADFNANAFSGRLESGYRFTTSLAGLTPFAAGQFTTYDLPAYGERVRTGNATFALNYDSKTVTEWRSELGLRADRSFAMAAGQLTLGGKLAWAHNFENERKLTATFQALPGASFEVNGAAMAEDAALTTVSLEMKWDNGLSAAAVFDGDFSGVSQAYAGWGLLRYQW
jgi:autotransporter-associated beta strand protein